MTDYNKQLKILKNVLELEAHSLLRVSERITPVQTEAICQIFDHLIKNDAQLIFCGVGKSGLIAKKLASTFASLGRPSFALHPVEALHGDLGRVRENDVIVLLSKSGTTEEIIKLKPYLPMVQERIIGLVGNMQSAIAQFCHVALDCSVEKEACLNNQAPTTSSTVALAMGDALAVLYEYMTDLSKESFAINHPGGLLGKSLRVKVQDLMVPISDCPVLRPEQVLRDALIEMTAKPIGGCAISDEQGIFKGILVEGDIRRTLTQFSTGLETPLLKILNAHPVSVTPESLALDALKIMENRDKPLNIVPVLKEKQIVGFLRLHDLIKEGFSKPT